MVSVQNSNEVSRHIEDLERRLRCVKRSLQKLFVAPSVAGIDEDDYFEFEVRNEEVKRLWEKFDCTWDELDSLYASQGASAAPTDWEDLYDSMQAEVRRVDIKFRKLKALAQSSVTQWAQPVAVATPHYPTQLPLIDIPIFNGDLSAWTRFRDTFVSLVHDNTHLSPVSKMHYLKNALVGEPASLLSGLSFDASSYQIGWDALMREYDNPRVLASRCLQRILNYKAPASGGEYGKYSSFLAEVGESIEAFHALGLENEGEVILSTLALRALDPNTRKQFELSHSGNRFPSADDIVAFTRQRMMACKMSRELQASEPHPQEASRSKPFARRKDGTTLFASDAEVGNRTKAPRSPTGRTSPSKAHRRSPRRRRQSGSPRGKSSSPVKEPCPRCESRHYLWHCDAFLALDAKERYEFVQSAGICFNCLSRKHRASNCGSVYSCRLCHAKHHTLLHSPKEKGSNDADSAGDTHHFSGHTLDTTERFPSQALMGTARAVVDGPRHSASARLLMDSGSQFTFITSKLAHQIGVNVQPFDGKISGLGGVVFDGIRGWVMLRLRSTLSDASFRVRALVLDRITSDVPRRPIPKKVTDQLSSYALADPSLGVSGPIDMLVGIDLYPRLISGAPVKAAEDSRLYLLPTALGNVVMGTYPENAIPAGISLLAQDGSSIEAQLRAFWELEEPAPVDRRHPDDEYCEELFVRTHSRTAEGRYVVRLPKRGPELEPEPNRAMALRRFYALERKLDRDSRLRAKYIEFMREYEQLGHMTVADNPAKYVIPHHGVWQVKPQETKLRVVFDASSSAGSRSLNDVLISGPKLQKDLSDVLTRFRLFRVGLTGDLVKMYRQILVKQEDRHLQHIFWRADPSEPVVEYELNTVTYGINTSAFQAIRTVEQLRDDEGEHFPLAAARLKTSLYVDDFVSGADSVEEAQALKEQLTGLFSRGGFEMGKWVSNIPELANHPEGSKLDHAMPQEGNQFVKILGLVWSPSDDIFSFTAREPLQMATKRVVLSHIARVFDPLGFLAPVIFHAKALLQEIWRHKLDWDEPLPETLQAEWTSLAVEWSSLSQVRIPRYVFAARSHLQLVGFCDASSRGYAATVYVRVSTLEGTIHSHLLKAKTKVAPTKFRSIAQLELCGALLLRRVMSSINIETSALPLYHTDSAVVLSWLSTPVYRLKVFEANRVSAILEASDPEQWRFVRSETNPADIASRGCLPSELLECPFWFQGPSWLRDRNLPLFQIGPQEPDTLETGMALLSRPSERAEDDSWIARFSSLQRLVRVTALLLRIARHARSCSYPLAGPILAAEFSDALLACVRAVQRTSLPPNMHSDSVPKEYRQLNPFVDELGLVRVGGRLRHSDAAYDQKHPLLLPQRHHLTHLVLDDLHIRHFHAGPTLVLSLLRSRFWVPRALKVIKSRIHRCTQCRIQRAQPKTPLMGDLPSARFERHRAFIQVGVDYAGPLLIKASRRRKAPTDKAYLCIFMCMSTRAIHLELVSSLATDAFLAALDRFVGRRGLPQCIHSDNGTNFVGASKMLKEFHSFLTTNEDKWVEHLAPKSVEWRFIPPRAPHFGGLWEAGVKSAKTLLTSIVGKQPLTFEELTTVLVRIEGTLNSRPLCPMRDDVESFEFLSPGHFLIGASLNSVPLDVESYPHLKLSSRWRLVQQNVTHVWLRWQRDFLHQLQQRTKWTENRSGLSVGDLVIMIESRTIPGHWPVARVVEVFPGKDGVVRVVSVRTPSAKILKRSVSTLVPLFADT